MKVSQLIKKIATNPAYGVSAYRKLFHAFDYFDIDYRLLHGYSFPPKSVCLILTEQCNLRCIMCDIGRRNAHPDQGIRSPLVQSIRAGDDEMTTADWLTVIEDLSHFVPKPLILLTGAEPFLYKNILSITETVIAKKLPLHITTNGTLLSTYARRLVDLCKQPGAMDITVSLDDIGENHDAIRGVTGTFQKPIEGMQSVARFRNERGQDFPAINITCTISNYNFKNLAAFAEWFITEKIPIESITFNHLWFKNAAIVEAHNRLYGKQWPAGQENIGDIDIAAIDMSLVQHHLQHIRKKYAHTSLRIHQQPDLNAEEARIYYSDPCRLVFYNRCTALWRNISITPKGNVILSPLCFLPPVGNVKTRPLSISWNSSDFKQVREQIRKAKTYPACSRCCMLFGSKPKSYKVKQWIS
jgi:MoaA/NifB/PqqE/SkfB family radical SAM enzyme